MQGPHGPESTTTHINRYRNRPTDPAWHRRLREQRAHARVLLRVASARDLLQTDLDELDAARHLLSNHHSAQQPPRPTMAPKAAPNYHGGYNSGYNGGYNNQRRYQPSVGEAEPP